MMGGDWLGRDGTQCRVPGERLVCGKGPHLNIMSHEKTVPSCQLHSDKEKVQNSVMLRLGPRSSITGIN